MKKIVSIFIFLKTPGNAFYRQSPNTRMSLLLAPHFYIVSLKPVFLATISIKLKYEFIVVIILRVDFLRLLITPLVSSSVSYHVLFYMKHVPHSHPLQSHWIIDSKRYLNDSLHSLFFFIFRNPIWPLSWCMIQQSYMCIFIFLTPSPKLSNQNALFIWCDVLIGCFFKYKYKIHIQKCYDWD